MFSLVSFYVTRSNLLSSGLYPVEDSLVQAGYTKTKDGYTKKESDLTILIKWNKKTREFDKNHYRFKVDKETTFLSKDFVDKESLETLINGQLSNQFGFVHYTKAKKKDWLKDSPRLVAHAGGAIREKEYNTFYTNSLEALQQNYSLGHRLFEMDFYLTSDKKLAAVHDWHQFGNKDDVALSSDEWKKFKAYGSPETPSRFTTMLIGDVLDQMVINKDMVLITDTKSMEIPKEDMITQFQDIVSEAKKRDKELLDRVIPQIYNQEMFGEIESIYPFKHVIYTLYASPDSGEEVLDFIAKHKEIEAVTVPIDDSRLTPKFIEQVHKLGKRVYVHTIQTYESLTKYAAINVDGFYTGLLTPQDMAVYESVSK
ncbi:MAG: glycerophosphodiester phosphodiesterase family protein [Streptococcus parasanguinis]